MDCTKCGAHLEEGMTCCPLCGAPREDLTEDTAAPKETAAVETEPAVEASSVEAPAADASQTEQPVEDPTAEEISAEEPDAQTAEEPNAEEPAVQPMEESNAEKPDWTQLTDAPKDQTPPKQTKRAALFAAVAVLAVAVLVFAVVVLVDKGGDNTASAGQSNTLETSDPADGGNGSGSAALNTTDESDPTAMNNLDENGNFIEHSYTVEKDAMTEEDVATVVATCGNGQLTNGELSFYYWQQYYNFMNMYGAYASMMGLDTTLPLSEQMNDASHTWEDYFLQTAMRSYWQTEAINTAAAEAGYVLDEETEEYLASIAETMAEEAETNGYESADAYIQDAYGPYVTMESYLNFAREMMTASGYVSTLYDAIEITDEDISAYFDENAEEYATEGISKDDPNMVNVRHILITPQADENAETDESGQPVLTEQNWADAKAKADEIYAQWKEGEATEESFAALATEHTEDPGSQSSGGLYEEVYPGQMVTEFNDWCFDASRQVGDTEIIKTTYGYHIMYFSGVCDRAYWYDVARQDYLTAQQQQILADMITATDLEVDYSKVKLTQTGLM